MTGRYVPGDAFGVGLDSLSNTASVQPIRLA
jgi:hypothetical protein